LMGRPDGLEVASALGIVVMVIMLVTFYLSERISRGAPTRNAIRSIILALCLLPTTAYSQPDEIIAVTPHWEGIRFEFSNGFAKYWKEKTGRDVAIRWLDVGGTSDIVKYISGQFKQTPKGIGIDIFFGGGADSFRELQNKDLLDPLEIAAEVLGAIPQNVSGVPLYSPDKRWFANSISAFGLLYNKVAIQRLGLAEPRRWSDLARPEYFDLVGAGDPRKSGSMHAMFEIILQGYGWDEGWKIIQKISRNVRNFSGTASQIGKEVATGEVVYGIAIDTYAGDIIRQVGTERLEYRLPEDFAALNGDCIALLKGAPNKPAASSFIEFILSEAGQRLWYAKKGSPGGPIRSELGKLPVLPSIYGTTEPATIFRGNPFTLSNILAYDAEKAGKRWNLVNDLFGVFMIDLHGRLSAVTDPTVLTGVPISEQEALELIGQSGWGSDQATRTELLKQWASAGSRLLPTADSTWDHLRWVPSAAFLLLLVALIIKRAAPRL